MAEGHVFKGVSREQYARLQEKARAAGIDMQGEQGSASKFGVEVAWSYNAESKELSVECLNTPFFMKKEDVDSKIRTLVQQTLA